MPESALCPEGDGGSILPTWEQPQGVGPKEPTPGQQAQAQAQGVGGEGVGEERIEFQRQEPSMETARWASSPPSGFH